MKSSRLAMAVLAWVTVALAGAGADIIKVQAAAECSEPAEPPLKVELNYVSYGRSGAGSRELAVASGAKGTTLTVGLPGTWEGKANLTFKNAAPPMRFTMNLARMPNNDLSALSLTSGSLSLQLGQVGTSATTRYFDAKGKAQESDKNAAYTVTARRRDNGQVDVELRRGQGASLGKELTVDWRGGTDDATLEREFILRAAALQAKQRGR